MNKKGGITVTAVAAVAAVGLTAGGVFGSQAGHPGRDCKIVVQVTKGQTQPKDHC